MRLDDQQNKALRRQAEAEGRSMHAVAADAIGEYIDRRAHRAIVEVLVRDYGLLESASARPRTSVFEQDAYPNLYVKTAALLHSLGVNHALVDGNKQLAFAAAAVFLEINGFVVDVHEDDQFEMVIAVASGKLTEPESIGELLREWSRPS